MNQFQKRLVGNGARFRGPLPINKQYQYDGSDGDMTPPEDDADHDLIPRRRNRRGDYRGPARQERTGRSIPNSLVYDGKTSWSSFYMKFQLFADGEQWSDLSKR